MIIKASVIRNAGPIAAILISAAIPIPAHPGPGGREAVDSTRSINSRKEFEQLRTQARTSSDFFALAQWCRARFSKYQQDKAKNEAELRDYYSRQHMVLPKFRPLDETLRLNMANDDKAMAHWSELASQYTGQARKVEGPRAHR